MYQHNLTIILKKAKKTLLNGSILALILSIWLFLEDYVYYNTQFNIAAEDAKNRTIILTLMVIIAAATEITFYIFKLIYLKYNKKSFSHLDTSNMAWVSCNKNFAISKDLSIIYYEPWYRLKPITIYLTDLVDYKLVNYREARWYPKTNDYIISIYFKNNKIKLLISLNALPAKSSGDMLVSILNNVILKNQK